MRKAMNDSMYSCTKLLAVVLLVLVQYWENICVSGLESEWSGGISISCREEERSALLHIHAALPFPIHYLDNGKWEGMECCRWERVTCNPITGHVTQLDLSVEFDPVNDWPNSWVISLNASMFLPLHQLRSLSLSGLGIYNCTDGAGFESWSNLTKLEMLDLSWNHLPNSIMSSLTKVSSLRLLYLDFNYMGGNINAPVKELSALNLELLSLSGSNFSGSFPNLGHWSSLKALSLAYNDLTGTLTSKGLCRLKNLEELDLSFNHFAGILPACMGNLSSLKLVNLKDNQFQIKFPSSIFERLVSLWYLSLRSNQFEGTLSMRSFWNHSNLEVLSLSTYDSCNFRVEVADLPFQLQVLRLANCILDVEPTFLCSQHKLRVLDLSNTRSKGPLSIVCLLENNTNLIALNLHKNLFTGPLQLSFLTHAKLSILDISHNHLSGELPANITTNLPNLLSLILSSNYFHGPLPLISTSKLQILDLSCNNLTDDIQNNFPRIFPSFLSLLDLSDNNFYGSFTKNFNFTQAMSLLLNDNNISGDIPTSICNTSFKVMDLSNNELNGILPDCIGYRNARPRPRGPYSALKLSGNHIEGSLPLEICVMQGFWFLDISDNKLSGSIPPCFNKSDLEIVYMSQNNLIGNFPITWLNITHINIIDIGENHLSGELPIWNGTGSKLNMLLARENMFGGPIPKTICQFKYLRILDLSHNNLIGQIPSCISDMGSRYYDLSMLGYISPYYIGVGGLNFSDGNFLLHVTSHIHLKAEESLQFGLKLVLKGRLDLYSKNNLIIVYVMDLSSNKLVGNIPEDIGRMNWLITLNLSNNHLSGEIPNSMSNLHQLESLDLSHNSLIGEIPKELTKLTSLESFSVAYNDLSGPTLDAEAQFSTFDNSSYEGNPNLCGPPLSKSCIPTLSTTQPFPNDNTDFLILFGSFSLFFVVSFWGFIAILYFKRNWLYALFTLVDWYGDMIYVKIILLARKIGAARTRRGN